MRKKQLEMLDLLVKAKFVEMFGDPVTNPMGWEVKPLGDFCYVTKLAGFEYTKYIHYQEQGEVIMVKGLNVKDRRLKLENVSYIEKSVSDNLPRSKLHYSDIVMTYIGINIGDVAIVDNKHLYHLAPNVAKIRPNSQDETNSLFLVNLLHYCREIFAGNATNTAKQALNMDKIRKIEVILPPLSLQTHFAEFVKKVERMKEDMKQGLERAEVLYKALMQGYFERGCSNE